MEQRPSTKSEVLFADYLGQAGQEWSFAPIIGRHRPDFLVNSRVVCEVSAIEADQLDRSCADKRHAFVVMPGFTPAPFIVSALLMRDGALLPVEYPELPGKVTDVWAVSAWLSGAGFRWSPPAGWSTFPKSTAR
jgi:hypothetical protein